MSINKHSQVTKISSFSTFTSWYKSQILKSNTEKSCLDQKIAENKYKNQYDYELQFISKLYVASLFSVILLLF
jgi:hypothetical protein